MVSRIKVLIESNALLGEGPRWDAAARRLLWVDIERGELHSFDGADHVTPLGARVGAATPTDDGEVLAALADRLVFVGDGVRTAAVFPHGPEVRTNDGACDPNGVFWIGTNRLDFAPGGGALYRFDGELELVLDDITLSNGLGWSPDGSRMYYIDSMTFRVDVFDFDGGISNRRPVCNVQ